jgi:hypothetical protein
MRAAAFYQGAAAFLLGYWKYVSFDHTDRTYGVTSWNLGNFGPFPAPTDLGLG